MTVKWVRLERQPVHWEQNAVGGHEVQVSSTFSCTTLSGECSQSLRTPLPSQVKNFLFSLVVVGTLAASAIFSHIWGGGSGRAKVKKKKKERIWTCIAAISFLLTDLSGKHSVSGHMTNKAKQSPFPSLGWTLAAFINLNPRITLSSRGFVTGWEP